MTKEDLADVLEIANTAKSVPSRLVTKLLDDRSELLSLLRESEHYIALGLASSTKTTKASRDRAAALWDRIRTVTKAEKDGTA